MCQSPPLLDLRNIEFAEFVALIFDYPITETAPDTSSDHPLWDLDLDSLIRFDPGRHAQHYTQLFSHPAFLIERYSDAQLEAGFGALTFRWGFDGNVSEIIWNKELGLDKREALVRSMYFLFADLFAGKPLWSACFMWWHELAYCFHQNLLSEEQNPDSAFIQEVMFSVLKDILHIPSDDCRQAALHGMNHLRHPGTEAYVEAFLNSRQDLSPKLMKYARRCMTFNVQ
jgi:hypothetical protein